MTHPPPAQSPARTIATIALLVGCLGAFSTTLAACASAPRAREEWGAVRMEVDPEGELPPRFWDSVELMQKAAAAFNEKKYNEALELYLTLIDKFPDERSFPLALFNAALCYEELDRFEEALGLYARLEAMPGPTYAPSVLLGRKAACHEEMKSWAEAEADLVKMTQLFSISEIERINALARLGVVRYEMGRYEEAKATLIEALEERYRRGGLQRLAVDTTYIAKGWFHLGQIYLMQYERIELVGDESELKQRLLAKADLLVRARVYFYRSIETYQLWWMSASLHQLGWGYETFYDAVMNAPLPSDLLPGERDVYVRKLESRVSTVIKKAEEAYSKNVDLDRRYNLQSPWAKKSADRLEALHAARARKP
ncbi:MAG: tetratricopeptide repeat protein [Deltaproteobacteria bacterium]|nr:tetratricopeptide repeat protein [Deltaproteobacteria bacterium]